MKKLKYYNLAILTGIVIAISIVSCKKESYLTDGGVSNPYSKFSTYDYLKNNKYHQFDTVLMLIDHYGLKDTINNAKTFFSPTDIAVNTLMKTLKVTSLNQFTDSVSAKFFTQYMFKTTISLDGTSETAVPYTNYVGKGAPCAIKKLKGSEAVFLTSSVLTLSYYTLEYIKVNGALDGSSSALPGDSVDVVLPCQTTGILTNSGTILHVLANSVTLNKL